MENECSIVKDLLPLYAEKMVSPETAVFVETHLKDCAACRREYESVRSTGSALTSPDRGADKDDPGAQTDLGAAPIAKLRKKLIRKRIMTALLAAAFVLALSLSAFAVLDAPVYFPYSDDLVSVTPSGSALVVSFDERVTDFEVSTFADTDDPDKTVCEITAWTSLWDDLFTKGSGTLSTSIDMRGKTDVTVVYSANDSHESVPVYGTLRGGLVSLPRLALGYYLIFAIAALVVFAVLFAVLRKRPEARKLTARLACYPLSYIAAHFIVRGFGTSTYSIVRDFYLIILISLLIFCCLLLLLGVIGIGKELKGN